MMYKVLCIKGRDVWPGIFASLKKGGEMRGLTNFGEMILLKYNSLW